MDIVDKKERIVSSFREAFDKNMAYKKVGVTDEERAMLEADQEFQGRLAYVLIAERETLIRKLKNFSLSNNEQVAFKATMEMGKILYPEFFREAPKSDKPSITPEELEAFYNDQSS